jgi:hypothetical protein
MKKRVLASFFNPRATTTTTTKKKQKNMAAPPFRLFDLERFELSAEADAFMRAHRHLVDGINSGAIPHPPRPQLIESAMQPRQPAHLYFDPETEALAFYIDLSSVENEASKIEDIERVARKVASGTPAEHVDVWGVINVHARVLQQFRRNVRDLAAAQGIDAVVDALERFPRVDEGLFFESLPAPPRTLLFGARASTGLVYPLDVVARQNAALWKVIAEARLPPERPSVPAEDITEEEREFLAALAESEREEEQRRERTLREEGEYPLTGALEREEPTEEGGAPHERLLDIRRERPEHYAILMRLFASTEWASRKVFEQIDDDLKSDDKNTRVDASGRLGQILWATDAVARALVIPLSALFADLNPEVENPSALDLLVGRGFDDEQLLTLVAWIETRSRVHDHFSKRMLVIFRGDPMEGRMDAEATGDVWADGYTEPLTKVEDERDEWMIDEFVQSRSAIKENPLRMTIVDPPAPEDAKARFQENVERELAQREEERARREWEKEQERLRLEEEEKERRWREEERRAEEEEERRRRRFGPSTTADIEFAKGSAAGDDNSAASDDEESGSGSDDLFPGQIASMPDVEGFSAALSSGNKLKARAALKNTHVPANANAHRKARAKMSQIVQGYRTLLASWPEVMGAAEGFFD